MATRTLTEPQVLASTKEALFPDTADHAYAVTDTQFATEAWRADRPIDETLKAHLRPFNHVRLGTGYPDLVGVGPLADPFVATDTVNLETAPLIAVEAKGHAGGSVDVDRGIAQAHDRLADANVAFLTAPLEPLERSSRALARDLNVGVLGVEASGDVEVLERPRVVGAQAPDAANVIKFQATAQGVADQSFGLNHPKNYLAYPIAVAHPDDTETLMETHVVGAVDSARTGAAFLGLVEEAPSGDVKLTSLGRELVRYAIDLEGDLQVAIERFEDWKRSTERFVNVAGEWGTLARWVVYSYPATELLVDELQRLHDGGRREPTLREVVLELFDTQPTFAIELFIRGTNEARERVFADEDSLDPDGMADGNVYASPTTFQLKAMLYHAGILTERGKEPHRLDPTEDIWALRQSF